MLYQEQLLIQYQVPSTSTSFNDETYINVFLLKMIGLVAFKNENLNSFKTIILSWWFHLSYGFLTTIYIFTFFKNCLKSFYSIEQISEMIILLNNHARFVILFSHRIELASLLRFSEHLWQNIELSERRNVIQFINKTKIVIYIFFGVCLLLCVFYVVLDQLLLPTKNDNETTTRMLPFDFYVDVENTQWFGIVLLLQGITMFGLALTTNGIDTVGLFLIMMACGHLKTLRYRIQNISALNNTNKDLEMNVFAKNILVCIKYHQLILEYCYQIQILMSPIFVTQLLGATYTMSLVGIKLVGDNPEKFKYITLLLVLLIQLFYLQWAPEMLIDESKAVANASYLVPPFGYENREVNELLYIFLMKSQRLIQLRAAGYFKLSMESFGLLITDAVSFFAVFRKFN